MDFLQLFRKAQPRRTECCVLKIELRARNSLADILEPEAAISFFRRLADEIASSAAGARSLFWAVDAGAYFVAIPSDEHKSAKIIACGLALSISESMGRCLASENIPAHLTPLGSTVVAAGISMGPAILSNPSMPTPVLGEVVSAAARLQSLANHLDVSILVDEMVAQGSGDVFELEPLKIENHPLKYKLLGVRH